ncbi:MAG: hypothetical protein K2N63_06860 [Lachnospiraceae bacterium]|nr:hypothetical protein [Lachnospiraceae bacterium]
MVTLKDNDAKEKETVLKDDASIYQKREEKSERQKFREMKTFQDKLNYFKMYYLKMVLVGVLVIGLVIYFIYTVASPKDKNLLRVAFVDYFFMDEVTTQMADDFIKEKNITLGEHEIISFDGTSYQISGSGNYNTATVFSTHVMAKEIDMVIAPESSFLAYAFNGTMASLTELLPSDLYGALSNRFFLSKVRQENEDFKDATGEDYVLGIYLDGTPFWEKYGQSVQGNDRPVIGIIVNGPNREQAIEFLRYLFE